MTDRIEASGLKVAKPLFDLVADEIAPGTGIAPGAFWSALADIVAELGPRTRAALERRDALQQQIDEWHLARRSQPFDRDA